MIKNCLDTHIDFDKIDLKNNMTYCPDKNNRYRFCGKFSPNKLESAILVCNYYKNKHFCFIKCLKDTGIPDGYFNILIEEFDWDCDLPDDICYLVDNVYKQLKKIKHN